MSKKVGLPTWMAVGLLTSVSGCSTTSVLLPVTSATTAQAAVIPLDGPFGNQEADFLSVEFAQNGVATVERAKVSPLVAVDTGTRDTQPVSAVQNYSKYADALHVRYLFVGTTSAERAALYSYRHVNITLRLIDTRTGQTRWIGRYGNQLWSSAVSTQGDLQLGARNLVKEFIKAGGEKLLAE